MKITVGNNRKVYTVFLIYTNNAAIINILWLQQTVHFANILIIKQFYFYFSFTLEPSRESSMRSSIRGSQGVRPCKRIAL